MTRQGRRNLALSPDGMTAVYEDDAIPGEVRLRFAERPDGRLVVVELTVLSEATRGGVTSWQLHQIPVARLEALANAPWMERSPPGGAGELPSPQTGALGRVAFRKPNLRLKVPQGRRKPDAFYERVARAYTEQAAVSRRPAQDIAEANDVPVSTVHRWIREARARGLLGPGQRQRGGR